MKKRIISLCLVVCLLAVAIVGGTMAYFTDTESKTNTMTVGNVDISLTDDFDDSVKMVPYEKISKVVDITNVGDVNAYVRLLLAIENTDGIKEHVYIDTPHMTAGAGTDLWKSDLGEIEKNGTVYSISCITIPAALSPKKSTADLYGIGADGMDNTLLKNIYLLGSANKTNFIDKLGTDKKFDIIVVAQGCQVFDEVEYATFDATKTLDLSFGAVNAENAVANNWFGEGFTASNN